MECCKNLYNIRKLIVFVTNCEFLIWVVLDSFINKIEIGKLDSDNKTKPIKIDLKLYAK